MKKIFCIVAIAATIFSQNVFAQDASNNTQAPQLLSLYYNIKDALVAGNATTAAAKAEAFVKTANGIDSKLIPADNKNTLVKDAASIAASKDLQAQRQHFAGLSTNLFALAKTTKLSDQPVYQAFCPMKKAYWLSSTPTIKNPYFGKAMLTCGKVVETIQ